MATRIDKQMQCDTEAFNKNNIVARTQVEHWTVLEVYLQTFQFAYYLFPIKAIALQVTFEAIDLAKIKHYEKESHRRRWLDNKRYKIGLTKLLLPERQLIQQMVYAALQKYEIYHESDRGEKIKRAIKAATNKYSTPYISLLNLLENTELSEEDLIIRYLGAILYFSNSNSNDLVTAIACLVCNLSPHNAAQLHMVFKQITPNYCSKRKALLIKKLAARFPTFIQLCRSEGKQSYFTGQEQPAKRWAGLVEDVFNKAVPWGTDCPKGAETAFSDRLHSWLEKIIKELRNRFMNSTDWQELSYLHALTCSNCFLPLMQELKFGCPRERLALPKFLIAEREDNQTMKKQHRQLSLKEEEQESLTKSIQGYLNQQQSRRAAVNIEYLDFLADNEPIKFEISGKETTRLNFTEPVEAHFSIPETTEMIKIISQDEEGELILATFSPPNVEITQSLTYRQRGKIEYIISLSNTTKLCLLASYQDGEDNIGYWHFDLTRLKNRLGLFQRLQLNAEYFRLPYQPFIRLIFLTLILTCGGLAALLINHVWQGVTGPTGKSETETERVERGYMTRTPKPVVPGGEQPDSNNNSAILAQPDNNNIYELVANNSSIVKPTAIKLLAKTKTIKLKLILENVNAPSRSYVVEIGKQELDIIWRSKPAQIITEHERRSVTIEVPAHIFESGEYQLFIKQISNDKDDLTIARYSVKIIAP